LYDRGVSRRVAYLLLIAAASVRLLIQAAAMPPYAGLYDLYHSRCGMAGGAPERDFGGSDMHPP
jgi:hypothetical protein